MNRLLPLALAAALAGCSIPGVTIGTPPAPASHTVADEQALTTAFLAYDAVLDLVEARVDAGKLKGEQAARVKVALERAWSLLQAAKSARLALSAADYATVYRNAVAALADARDAAK